MSLHITDKEVQKRIKQLGYKGCKNCQHQIAPLRKCKWGVVGKFSKIYGGCPIGCQKPDEVIKDSEVGKCYEEKEKIDRLLKRNMI